jgi:hypothetical protein
MLSRAPGMKHARLTPICADHRQCSPETLSPFGSTLADSIFTLWNQKD